MAEYNDDSIDIHTNQSAGEDEEDEEQSSQESPYHNPLDQSVGAANHLKHQRVATGGAHSGRQSEGSDTRGISYNSLRNQLEIKNQPQNQESLTESKNRWEESESMRESWNHYRNL